MKEPGLSLPPRPFLSWELALGLSTLHPCVATGEAHLAESTALLLAEAVKVTRRKLCSGLMEEGAQVQRATPEAAAQAWGLPPRGEAELLLRRPRACTPCSLIFIGRKLVVSVARELGARRKVFSQSHTSYGCGFSAHVPSPRWGSLDNATS